MHWIKLASTRYFDFAGRSRRREYWGFVLCWFVLAILLRWIDHVAGLEYAAVGAVRDQGGRLSGFFLLATLIPGLAIAVRRLHDSNRSGWWVVLPFAPILFWMIAILGGFNAPLLFGVVMVAIVVAPFVLLVFLCLGGTPGPNRFGADPRGIEDVAEVFR